MGVEDHGAVFLVKFAELAGSAVGSNVIVDQLPHIPVRLRHGDWVLGVPEGIHVAGGRDGHNSAGFRGIAHDRWLADVVVRVHKVVTALFVEDPFERHADALRVVVLVVAASVPGGSDAGGIQAEIVQNREGKRHVIRDLFSGKMAEINIFAHLHVAGAFQVPCEKMSQDLRRDGEVRHDIFFADPDKGIDLRRVHAIDFVLFVQTPQTGRDRHHGELAPDPVFAADIPELHGKRRRHKLFVLMGQIVVMVHIDNAAVVNDQADGNFAHVFTLRVAVALI